MDQDKIDLSSVNQQPKQKKQFKFPKLKNPFKKNSAGPGRDQYGQFASGSGGLLKNRNFNWKRAAPLVIVVALVGGFFVFRSFAGTYTACIKNDATQAYVYDAECVTDSSEASVVRLYYGIFNRAPDKSGLQYWAGKLNAKSVTLTEMARQFMGSNEFKNKYGALSDEAFVKAMYPQVFARNPDTGGLNYWTNKLKNKSVTRQAMMVNFTQSSEMKRNFATRVALALEIDPSKLGTGAVPLAGRVTCATAPKTESANKWCASKVGSRPSETTINTASVSLEGLSVTSKPGAYLVCGLVKSTGVSSDDKPGTRSELSIAPATGPLVSSIPSGYALHDFPGLSSFYVTNNSVANKTSKSCKVVDILPSVEKTLVINTITGVQPAGAEVAFDINSLTISSVLADTTTVFVEAFDTSRTTEFKPCSSYDPGASCNNETIEVAGVAKKVPVRKNFGIDANASTNKPNWVQRTDYIQGKNTINFDLSGRSAASVMSLKVTNADTGALIPGYKVIMFDETSSDGTRTVFKTVDSTAPVIKSSDYGDLFVELNLPKPTKVKAEFSVQSEDGVVIIYKSSLSRGWYEEQF